MDKRASRRNHARRGMSKHLIFVYGTLKRGWGNNAIIHDQKYIGVGTTSPDFEMFSLGGYPGVIEGDKRISGELRSEEHTSELQSLMRISYAVFCLKKKNNY